MFFVHRVTDTLAIPPEALALPTQQAVEQAIDERYPGRVWLDLGLVIGRYHSPRQNTGGDHSPEEEKDNQSSNMNKSNRISPDRDAIIVGPGACVAGTAASHVRTTFSLVVFRPFLEQVCVGTIRASTPQGIQITLGNFFDQIYVPVYWMPRPSVYESDKGLWVWTPSYDDDDDDDEEDTEETHKSQTDEKAPQSPESAGTSHHDPAATAMNEPVRYEMELGSTIRFRVKSIQFARVTQTAKGRQATVSTTMNPADPVAATVSTNTSASHSNNLTSDGTWTAADGGDGVTSNTTTTTTTSSSSASSSLVRRRSSSVGLDEHQAPPPPMKILASLCEDGLGLVSWWQADEEDEDNDVDENSKVLREEDTGEEVHVGIVHARVKEEETNIKRFEI